ncbi:MAG TPA: DUF3373 family protein [Epsilonproteobacteria bacterium]|nr:DUF3373 family protein [Campylobacterota bacterium]
MKTIIKASLVAAVALTSANAVSNSALVAKLNSLESELSSIKAKLKKQNKKINKVKSHDAGDNIKWGVDFRTAMDKIKYDMADGSTRDKKIIFTNRLWLNMAYSPNTKNVFKGQLSMYKAYGADFGETPDPSLNPFGMRGTGFDTFDWVTNEALRDGRVSVRQAYWLYLGDKFLGADIPWTFSLGRRPSTNGFLASLRDDDAPQSPLGHIINVEFDGLSSKLDLSNVTGVPGMSFKLCMGLGSTNATPRLGTLAMTDYAKDDNALNDTQLAGFIFEPYNDGQYIVKTTAFKAFNMPGFDSSAFMTAFQGGAADFSQNGNMLGAAISVMVDGLAEEGILADTKVFGSFAWSKTDPKSGQYMLGLDPTVTGMAAGAAAGESKSGTSYWFGAQVPVTEEGKFGLEYNHGSQYWRPFDYAEDTLAGSKLAARGSAIEAYFTYQLTEALSAQIRYTKIDYDYTGSNGFFGSGGTPLKISDVKAASASFDQLAQAGVIQHQDQEGIIADLMGAGLTQEEAVGTLLSKSMSSSIVEAAQDLRFYIRYRF